MSSEYNLFIRAMNIMAKALGVADRYSDRGSFSRLSTATNYAEIRNRVTASLDKEWKSDRAGCLGKAVSMLDSALQEEGNSQFICAAEIAMWFDRRITYYPTNDQYLIDASFLSPTGTKRARSVDFLNTPESIRETGIMILPKFSCSSTYSEEVKSGNPSRPGKKVVRRTFNRDSVYFLNCELNNVAYIPLDKREVVVHNVIIHKDKFNYGTHGARDGFRVAFAPMISAPGFPFIPIHVTIEEKGGIMDGFQIRELKEPEKLEKRFEEDLLLACRQNVDLAFFPEMVGTEMMIDRKYNTSKNLQRIKRESGKDLPCVTIFPTIWKDRRNYAVIADMNGTILGEQNKLYPFIMTNHGKEKDVVGLEDQSKENGADKPGAEDLPTDAGQCNSSVNKILQGIEDIVIPDIPEITVVHIPGYARIAIMICAQFLQENVINSCIDIVCRYLNVNMIIVPSFSGGETDFVRKIKSLEKYGTSVIWGNCCGAIASEKKVIGGASLAGTDGIYRFGSKCKCAVNEDGKQRAVCSIQDTCIFTVDIPAKMSGQKPEGARIPDPIEHFFIKKKERRKG